MIDLKQGLEKHAYVIVRVRDSAGYTKDTTIDMFRATEAVENIVAGFLRSKVEIIVNGTNIILNCSIFELAKAYAEQCTQFPKEKTDESMS